MKITLTEKQVVLAGFDSPGPDRPKVVKRSKRGWTLDLDEEQIDMLTDLAETYEFGGCDPADSTSARGILKKLKGAK